ncbi:MAG TPA: hypothetical protein VGV61_00445 [Thermoanaerobaculia bacterium]|jgi:hypothetical protein|nr:hypothetical protein [Thermoanaerobaculia bacterium]
MSTERTHLVSHPAATAVVGELMRFLLSRSPVGAPAPMPLLDRLDEALRIYEVEYRRYLNGQSGDAHGHRPPLELGAVLATVFAELAAGADRRQALGFRLDALEARFRAAQRLLTQRLERADRHLPLRCPRLVS